MSELARRAPGPARAKEPAADVAVLAAPRGAELVRGVRPVGHPQPAGRPLRQEFGLFARDWGFDLGEVAVRCRCGRATWT